MAESGPPAKRQRKGGDDTALARRDIDECARGAMSVFERMKAENLSLPIHSYNVLLHLCAGGNQPDDAPKRLYPTQAAQVFEHMSANRVAAVEMTYTALVRVNAATDPVKAYQMIKDMRSAGVVPRLRTFSPALSGFCDVGDLDNALVVEGDIRSSGIALSEVEYIALLNSFTKLGSAHLKEACWSLLRRMKDDIRLASPDLLLAVSDLFRSFSPEWEVNSMTVDEFGLNLSDSTVKLQAIDLTDSEQKELAGAIAALSRSREQRDKDFDSFIEWSARHGPFDTIVDGANVGMYNQNFEDACFNFQQVERILALLREERGSEAKPALLVLHQRRVRGGPANAPRSAALIRQWREKNELYTTPAGSNDDWYWLHAAVTAGSGGILVTNDELRDHVFQMLPSPRLFYKWKERHQVRFTFSPAGVELLRPPPFTTCIQEAQDGSWWAFPSSESAEWVCAKRLPRLRS